MPWTAAAIVAAAGIGAYATNQASKSQSQGSQDAIGEQQREYDLARSDYAPYRQAGVDALGQLQTDINTPITAEQVMSDPGYQFGLNQGQTALDRKIAAMGGRVSGAALKGADQYATDYASTQYGAAYQRGQDRLNRLAAIAGIGQTATNGSAAAGMNSANQISGLLSAQGNANAASQLAQGNIWGNAGNQLAALYGRGGNNNGNGMSPYWNSQNPNYAQMGNWNNNGNGYGGSGSTQYGDGYGPI